MTAGVVPGSTVYIAGAGPVGIAAAVSAQLLGASCGIVGDLNADRLAKVRTTAAVCARRPAAVARVRSA